MSPLTIASAAASNLETDELFRASAWRCLANFGQLSKPCERAITNCASASAHFLLPGSPPNNSRRAEAPTSPVQPPNPPPAPRGLLPPPRFSSGPIHCSDQSPMALSSPPLQDS